MIEMTYSREYEQKQENSEDIENTRENVQEQRNVIHAGLSTEFQD